MRTTEDGDPNQVHASQIVGVTLAVGALCYAAASGFRADSPWLIAGAAGFLALLALLLVDLRRRVERLRAELRSTVTPTARDGGSHAFDREVTELASRAAVIGDRTPRLLIALGQEELRDTSKLLDEFGRQRDVSYAGEDRHWLLRLTRHATSSIQATSKTTVDAGGRGFADGGFWLSEFGQRYLEAQREAVARGVRIQRVFVMDRPELLDDANFIEVYRQQTAAGIQVRVIDPSEQPGGEENAPPDFILFDKEINYETIPAEDPLPTGHPVIVQTSLVSDRQRVAERVQYFEKLWAAAR